MDRLTSGSVARDVRMGDQFARVREGDVARRMDLFDSSADRRRGSGGRRPSSITEINHVRNVTNITNVRNVTNTQIFIGGAPSTWRYRGPVAPVYLDSAFRFHYYGPRVFASYTWYPHWRPWVHWTWHYPVRPIWDPRPVWVRPIYYEPCVRWVYWNVPAWRPLPVVASGTWVDVEPVAVPAESYDLQLLAVRFVDPGHPEEQLGPRYRVWLRNNSEVPIEQPFSVRLFATAGEQLTPDAPHAGVRVQRIEAGEVQAVDIRLPVEVYAAGDEAAGEGAPFEFVHALVDANREIDEVDETNNGAVIPREDVLPVDPAAFELDTSEAAPGGEVIVAGEGFGPQPGVVLLHVGGLELTAEILGWYDLGVRIAIPELPVTAASEAELVVIRGDGAAANPLPLTVLPAATAEANAAEAESDVPEPPAP